jgi:glucan phosphoethanolaminetransferase (alkaline phosphatase superfamily)
LWIFWFEILRIPSFTQLKAQRYAEELQIFDQLKDKIKTGQIQFRATKKEKDETYLVILGESLNKHHMGLYGYFRETTPNLNRYFQENKILKFTNTYANYINTSKAWSFGLTQANQYNKKSYYTSLNILNILKKASIETYWVSNQALVGGWDNMVSIIAHQADYVIGTNHSVGKKIHTEDYDEVLIPKIEKILSQRSDKTRVIFVHLMGSHSSYSNRYPKSFNHFTHMPKEYITEHINHYDNSVLYNDFIVSKLIHELEKKKGVTAVIYMPDHAEDVIHNKGHHSGKRFTFDMIEIPFICWFSKAYQKKYIETYKTFKANQNRLFSNDMFYDTLLGLLQVDTDATDIKFDLSSKEYELQDEDALTQHGKKHYNSKKNHFYWNKLKIN